MTDRYVEAHVSAAIATEAMEQGLEVRVSGEQLFVFGTVATEARRRTVCAIAAEHAPGYAVHDELTVYDARPIDGSPQ